MKLTLPWPPSLNTYYRSLRHGPMAGRVLKSRIGRQFDREASYALAAQGCPRKPLRGRLRVEVQAAPPDGRRRDLDNLLKPVLDALTDGHIWLDDSQVDDLRIIRLDSIPGGSLSIEIEEIGPERITKRPPRRIRTPSVGAR